MLGQKCHFAHGDAELRKPDDPISQELMNLALKSVQWNNCNQGARGRGGADRGNRGRGGFRGGANQFQNPNQRGGNQFNNPRGGGQFNPRGGAPQGRGGFNQMGNTPGGYP